MANLSVYKKLILGGAYILIYYVGIDISKYKHDFCIISNAGELIVENFSFQNNKIGFQTFLDQLKPYNKSDIRIAFEATGHYSLNLELFLVNNGFSFMKVNPLIIHQLLKTRSLRKLRLIKLMLYPSFNI